MEGSSTSVVRFLLTKAEVSSIEHKIMLAPPTDPPVLFDLIRLRRVNKHNKGNFFTKI